MLLYLYVMSLIVEVNIVLLDDMYFILNGLLNL